MKIVEKSVGWLKPYGKNNKKHPPEQVEAIAASIRRHGFTQPVVADSSGTVVIGHGRLEAAKSLGMATVPTHVLPEDVTPSRVRALRLLDNGISDMGEYDLDAVREELDLLEDPELDALFEKTLAADAEESAGYGGSGDGGGDGYQQAELHDVVIVVTDEQRRTIQKALDLAKKDPRTDVDNHNANGNAMAAICAEYLANW